MEDSEERKLVSLQIIWMICQHLSLYQFWIKTLLENVVRLQF
uniref:Uncharacterized protein n=1 Tax=Siphoviridae sp. ctYh54 TaxID=2826379 RepID=A0A8S5MEC9_9CAUD|nr:MAG TPA: hypothetical protein [Siphoviridae sp. ctYh54]